MRLNHPEGHSFRVRRARRCGRLLPAREVWHAGRWRRDRYMPPSLTEWSRIGLRCSTTAVTVVCSSLVTSQRATSWRRHCCWCGCGCLLVVLVLLSLLLLLLLLSLLLSSCCRVALAVRRAPFPDPRLDADERWREKERERERNRKNEREKERGRERERERERKREKEKRVREREREREGEGERVFRQSTPARIVVIALKRPFARR